MPALDNISKPTAVVHTDKSGTTAAGVATAPPTTGVDTGLQVHASLGSAVIPVAQELQGAANYATSQVALNSSTATQLLAARATRRCSLITNDDAAINIWVGTAAVTSGTGQLVKPGNSLTVPTTAAIYAIATSATPTASISEVYD